MATQTKIAAQGTYVYFGGGLHPAKDNDDASRLFSKWRDHNGYGASDLNSKDGRIYTDGKLVAHVSYNGRVWDMAGQEISNEPHAEQHLQESKGIVGSLKLAVDELDDKGVIASFTKLLMARMMEGDDVTEQLHALNYLRQQAGLKPIVIPAGGVGGGGSAAPKQEAPREKYTPPKQDIRPGDMVVRVPPDAQMLPDNNEWTNRFDIKSESSNRLYRIAQNKKKRFWGCSCPGWISRKKCKHLTALGLPGEYTPYEAKLKQGSKKTAGKFKLYTGPTIVKETADILRNAGIQVTTEGTEHVHFLADGDRDGVTLQLREVLGPQWGVRNVQQLASKQGADLVHSNDDLGLKLEPAGPKNEQPKIPGPEAGPSNDELNANGHSENGEGGSPMYDGNLKSPERQNVNAIREALDTQVEMEVGKPIEQKQKEVEMAEKVQDAALAQGAGAITGAPGAAGAAEVEAKPGTQIIINVASQEKEAAQRVQINDGSGVDSGKEGILIPWDNPKAQTVRGEYPFVGGRTPQSMGWVAILLDDGTVTTVPKGNVRIVKRSAEPIGGEPEMQGGITSGHGGGMFGGTDLEGPSFHVGFTLRGYHREASFTSVEAAEKFISVASKKFGKLAGDWTMKCPHCGGQASKDKPQDNYKCKCGWDSGQSKTSNETSADYQRGYTDGWNHEGPESEDNTEYSNGYWKGYDDKRRHTKSGATVDPAQKQLVLEWLKSNNLTTGEVEKRLGGGKYSNKAYPILMELAKEGLVKHKQMRWYLKTATKKVADGWTNWETETVNLYITNDRKSYDKWWTLAEGAVDSGMSAEQLAKQYEKVFADKQRQFIREQNQEQNESGVITNIAPTNWLEIAEDAMHYVINERKAGEINYERMHGPAEKRFEKMIEPGDAERAKGMGISLSSLRTATIRLKVGGGMPAKGTPEYHQLQIAIKTLKMPDAMAGVMGGPGKADSLQILQRYGLTWDGEKVVKTAGDGMAKTEKELEKEAGFNFFFPGQVLKEFYPEIQHEIVDYPNATNQSISQESPELVGDAGHEIDGLVDSALDTTIVEMIQLPADVGDFEPMGMAASKRAADYSSTSPAGGMGIGRDGKPEVLEGAPLRKENDIRGYMFTDEFYGQYQGVPGAAFNVASKTAAEGGEVKQFTDFLCLVCGEIAATMVAAFKVTHRPLLDKIPGVGEIQLDQIEQTQNLSGGQPLTITGSRVQFLLEQLNDGDIKQAINEAWAQSAVWHDGGNGGFVYEVFVRPETIDTESMKMKYKFVCGTKQ